MKKLSTICCALGAAVLLASDAFAAVAEDAPVVTAAQSVIELDLSVDGKASVSLTSNVSTGYSWNLAKPLAADSPVAVSMDLCRDKPKDGEIPMCGAPEETVVTFTGLHEGTATVTLVYIRPWEKGKAPVDSRTFLITVTK